MKFLEPGQEIETTIVAISGDYVFLNLNTKSEGVLERAELLDKDGNCKVKEGDTIKVFFTGEKGGEMRFTTKISGGKADQAMLENAHKNGIPVEGFVEKEIKGGFEVKIGNTRAFCPFSQMGFRQKQEPSFYIGKHLTFKIQEYKENGRNILVSNRAIEEIAYQEGLNELKKEITEGAIVSGTVESIQSFGAFVEISGFRVLLPISEISLSRVSDINEHLAVGQEIKAKVISTDWSKERVSISLKALIKSPWEGAAQKYPVGSKHKGKISRIADFGLFVELESGIDGLVHKSELQEADFNTNLNKKYKTGETIEVEVKSVDKDQNRISLTTGSAKEEDSTAKQYMSNQDDNDTYNPFAALLKK